jgi:hypothetical protein
MKLIEDYRRRGWELKPVQAGLKRPVVKGWPDKKFGPDDFSDNGNVAIRVGKQSDGLVDADLDCEEAIALAPLYLPVTGARFGRPSKPLSHWFYIAQGATFETFADPISGEMLLELRADGRDGGAHITLVPPSVTDGEEREWDNGTIEPATVESWWLRTCLARLAVGCVVMRYISEYAARRPGPDLPGVLWEFDHDLGRPAYRWLGKPDPDAPQRPLKPRLERSERDIALDELARAIPNANVGWHDWNRLGMAFFVASNGSDEGYIAFDDWSAKSSKYDPESVKERWRNYRRSRPSRIGMGTLVHLARQAGWKARAA